MRYLSNAAMLVAALAVVAPAAAQVTSPGPTWYNPSGAPIPGAPMASPNPPSYNPPPAVTTGGPVYYNQPGAPYAQPQPPIPAPQQFAAHPGGNANNGQVWQNGRWVSMPGPSANYGGGNPDRWGGNVGGRWWGGSQAPGGWGGYTRPRRGRTLPPYWMQSNFQIPDYLSFGLAAPPYGYFWVRYYDDAVLVDAQGGIHNSVSGIAWGSSAGAYAGGGYASSSASAYASGGQMTVIDPNQGYYAPPQGGYAPPVAYGPPAVQVQGCPQVCPPPVVYQGGGYQQGGAYYGGGGYYAGGSTTTTVVIQSPPVVTTTIIEEEIVTEEVVTTTYVAPRRVVRRAPPPRKYRPKPRPTRKQCGCQCVCR